MASLLFFPSSLPETSQTPSDAKTAPHLKNCVVKRKVQWTLKCLLRYLLAVKHSAPQFLVYKTDIMIPPRALGCCEINYITIIM